MSASPRKEVADLSQRTREQKKNIMPICISSNSPLPGVGGESTGSDVVERKTARTASGIG
jgi:hypothetical protein